MLGKVIGIICFIALIFGFITGSVAEVGKAAVEGAGAAVSLTVSLVGMMCLWCGIMNVFKTAGVVEKLVRLISPLIKLCFPMSYNNRHGTGAITANIAANLLGIGNAATPLALTAMKELNEINPTPTIASDDMITFTVLNTASVSLIPANIIALRYAAGSANPASVVVPIWICSFSGATVAVVLTRLMNKFSPKRKKREKMSPYDDGKTARRA